MDWSWGADDRTARRRMGEDAEEELEDTYGADIFASKVEDKAADERAAQEKRAVVSWGTGVCGGESSSGGFKSF